MLEPIGGREPEWVHVRCDRCGEPLRARIHLTNDLSADYDSKGRLRGYLTRKTLVGDGPCFQKIQVHIQFNPRRRRKKIEVDGGDPLSAAEFERLLADRAQSPRLA